MNNGQKRSAAGRRIYALDIETAPQSERVADMMEAAEPVKALLDSDAPIDKKAATATIKDVDGFSIGNRSDPDKIREHLQSQYDGLHAKATKLCSFDPMLGMVCCIGIAGRIDGKALGVARTLADFHAGDPDDLLDDGARDGAEKQLLAWFWNIAQNIDVVVSWNGLMFDMPFLERRSILQGIVPTKSFDTRRYSYTPHCDLMQWESQWDRPKWRGLDKMVRLAGIGQDKGGMDGSQVAQYADDGRWDEIASYCLGDVLDRTLPLYELFAPIIPGHAGVIRPQSQK